MATTALKESERVDKALAEQGREPLALFRKKTGIISIGLRIAQICVLVRNVQIAHHNYRFSLISQLSEVSNQMAAEGPFVIESLQKAMAVWSVRVYDDKLEELGRQNSSFKISCLVPDPRFHGDRFQVTCDQSGDAAISRPTGRIAVRLITYKPRPRQQVFLDLNFLQTDDIVLRIGEPILQSGTQTGPKTINIPGRYPHEAIQLMR